VDEMNVFITGDAGFIGTHFSNYFRESGAKVFGCDIKHGEDARDWFKTDRKEWDLLIHCAANVGGRAAIDKAPLWVAENMGIDQAAMEWAVKTQTPMLYFSSSAAYPTKLQEFDPDFVLTEDDIALEDTLGAPDNTYGWSKLTGEYMARIAQSHGATIHIVRPFSGYGSDQSADYPFGAFRDRILAKENPFIVWSDGTQKRDWIHIDDIILACVAIIKTNYQNPVNLATGRGVSFIELAHIFGAKTIKTLPNALRGCSYRVGSPSLLHNFHIPKVTIEQGVERALMGAW
jgi:nucleoside-diphosphate-sugar epimerase